jgi:hypothetical protein
MKGICWLAGLMVVALTFVWMLDAGKRGDDAAAGSDTTTADVGPLDGMTFVGKIGPGGEPKDAPDVFVFQDGHFVSKDHAARCRYPARPYFVRTVGDATEFVSETRCPHKDATIVWRGRVAGDQISGVAAWTSQRWRWSWKTEYAFDGRIMEADARPPQPPSVSRH